MIVIGELINSSRQPVEEAFLNRQADILVDLAIKQQQAGCSYLEVNAATIIDQEDELLKWIIPILQEQVSIPLSIDSPNPRALEAGLKVHKGQALLSSLPGRQAEMEEILPLIRDFRPEVIVSALDESGFPDTPEKIIKIADRILNRLFSTTSLSQDQASATLGQFADQASIAPWAREAAAVAATKGIISGRSGGNFAPTANATRAESATMLYNLIRSAGLLK